MIFLTIALFLTLAGFFLLEVFKNLVFSKYNVLWEIAITARIRIDFYGAIIPTTFSFSIIFYLVCLRKFSARQYFSYFLLSISITGIFTTPSSLGIGFYYLFSALLVGLLVFSITFYEKGFRKLLVYRDWQNFEFTKGNYVDALLIAFTYTSLSVLVLDLAYAFLNALFSITTYVGAMGLADTIVFSGLSASVGVTFVSLCVMLIYEDMHHQ
jgi:hypothetical protein